MIHRKARKKISQSQAEVTVIWAEISHEDPFLLRHAVLVWSNGLKFLIFIIIFTGEIKKKDVVPWICESLPGHAAKPLWSQSCLKDGALTLREAHPSLPWGLWLPHSCCLSEWGGWRPTELSDLHRQTKARLMGSPHP